MVRVRIECNILMIQGPSPCASRCLRRRLASISVRFLRRAACSASTCARMPSMLLRLVGLGASPPPPPPPPLPPPPPPPLSPPPPPTAADAVRIITVESAAAATLPRAGTPSAPPGIPPGGSEEESTPLADVVTDVVTDVLTDVVTEEESTPLAAGARLGRIADGPSCCKLRRRVMGSDSRGCGTLERHTALAAGLAATLGPAGLAAALPAGWGLAVLVGAAASAGFIAGSISDGVAAAAAAAAAHRCARASMVA